MDRWTARNAIYHTTWEGDPDGNAHGGDDDPTARLRNFSMVNIPHLLTLNQTLVTQGSPTNSPVQQRRDQPPPASPESYADGDVGYAAAKGIGEPDDKNRPPMYQGTASGGGQGKTALVTTLPSHARCLVSFVTPFCFSNNGPN